MTYLFRKMITGQKSRIHAIGLLVSFGLITAGCTTPTVLSTPNSCVTLVPADWAKGVSAPDLPADDSVGSWVSFGDAAVGKLDIANGRTRDTLHIVSACESRDKAAVRRASKGFFGRLFD